MATQTGDWQEESRVSIGRIFSRAFGVMGNNPVAIFGIAFLFGALPQTLYGYFLQPDLIASASGNTLATMVISLGAYVLFLIFGMLAQGAVVRATTAYAAGGRASFGQSITTGLSMAVPLIGLSIVLVLALILGFALLVIPGIILYIMWSVAAPALVTEQSGVFTALGRSRFLTKGARWKIFGLQIVLLVIFWLLSAVVGVAMLAGGGVQGMAQGFVTGQVSAGFLLLSAITSTLTTAFWGTVQTSLYITLRNWKEGPQAEALADVFA